MKGTDILNHTKKDKTDTMKSEEIVKIANKYIGQTETQNNSGFNDKLFEKRMKDTGWIKGAS